MDPFMNSLVVAFISSVIALVIGSMAGYADHRLCQWFYSFYRLGDA